MNCMKTKTEAGMFLEIFEVRTTSIQSGDIIQLFKLYMCWQF